MKAKIMNKWLMDFDDKLIEKAEKKKDKKRSYFAFLRNKINDVARQTKCRYMLLNELNSKGIDTVVEYFGGVGINSLMAQKLLNPSYHIIYDLDEKCIKHLKKNFKKVVKTNSYKIIGSNNYNNCLYDMDFNSFTAKQFIDNDKNIQDSLTQTFKRKPKAVILTDSALPYLHLNKKIYEKILGLGINHEMDYIIGFSKLLKNKYNYFITKCTYHAHAAYFLIESYEEKEDKIEIKKVEETNGFKIIKGE